MKRCTRWLSGLRAATGLAVVLAMSAVALAYNPPVDRAGPLIVRIEGPEEVTQVDAPQKVRVIVENKHDRRIEGTLEIRVVDRWRADPVGAVPFAVEPGASAARDFQVTAGQGTFSALYPIHAVARFELDGKKLEAHPILILEAKLPRRPRPTAAVEWKPYTLPENAELAVWRLPAVRAVLTVFGEAPQVMPVGWQGGEARTGGSMRVAQQTLGDQAREVIAIHPPWQQGRVGTLWSEYPIALPSTKPIKLTFATGIVPEGQSDGVTFRVRVLPLEAPDGQAGKVVFERHSAAKTWEPAEADLSAWAGRAVRLQLESHPGPKNNTGWDQSFWAEPVLVAGAPPAESPFPPTGDAGSRVLGEVGRGARRYSVRVWPGRRGLLDSAIGFGDGGRRLCLRGLEVRVLGSRLDDRRSPVVLKEAKEEACPGGIQVRHRFESRAGTFDLVIRLFVEKEVLRARIELQNTPAPKPWQHVHLEDTAAGPWSQPVRQVYGGAGNVIRDPGEFRLGFDGHQLSTSFVGFDFANGVSLVQGVDSVPDHFQVAPERRHYSLHVPHALTYTFIPADNVWEAVKGWRDTNGLKAAAGVPHAAGRFVFDLWGGRYQPTADALKRAFRYGLTDSLVIFHNWQRWGYDYRLPDLYPPNPRLGTLDEMRALVQTCKEVGVPFAPHDNYIDFYPDADGFSYEKHIAFHADGAPVRAWLNEGRKAQSYRFRADSVAPFLQRNLRWIRGGFAPTAYFIDVWSSIGPYDYWTADGRFFDRNTTRTSWGEHFAWIRDLLGAGAPQISESGHDQLIGWLDGAQTNHLRVGKPGTGYNRWCVWDIPHGDAERTPWLDAAHHDRFILHGAGYPSRYEGGLDPQAHGIYSDDYMTSEVLTGHPAMVAQAFGRDMVRKYWLLHDVARALALRRIEGLEFAAGDLHRQQVRWSGGGQVWVNRGSQDWTVEGVTLPQYGFLVRVPTQDGKGQVEAWIARRDGIIVEMSRSPDALYVNGRQVVGGPLPIRVSVDTMRYAADRRLEFTLRWQAEAPIPAGWSPFLHFCDDEGEIVFQVGHQPGRFDTPQQGAIAGSAAGGIPQDVKAGRTFELRVGIYNPATGERLALAGPDDRSRRIRRGTIRLEGEGDRVTGVTWTPHKAEPDPLLARQNPEGNPVDFGPVVTAAGCRLTREGDVLVVTPLPEPRAKKATMQIRWSDLPWKLPEPTRVEAVAEDGKVISRQEVCRQADQIILTLGPEAFCCRLTR